jgi:hypothetical protein
MPMVPSKPPKVYEIEFNEEPSATKCPIQSGKKIKPKNMSKKDAPKQMITSTYSTH